ncbi:hypothetical protein ACFSO7_17355 [Bacillus sp. CGMCC 1.16607]|uniref:hypothetical protein n=1 Tax=Bacillus sp. CGMCC 1.16607 TaxID=3351842 RepID=UPI0036409616
MFPAINVNRQMPISYHLMIPSGSKPKNWTEQQPSMDKLIKPLENQAILIEQAFKGHLHEPLKESFLRYENIRRNGYFSYEQ